MTFFAEFKNIAKSWCMATRADFFVARGIYTRYVGQRAGQDRSVGSDVVGRERLFSMRRGTTFRYKIYLVKCCSVNSTP